MIGRAILGRFAAGRRFLESRERRIVSETQGRSRVHLGCGENHLDGYLNVDYPPAKHTLQTRTAADMFADIRTLDFPAGSFAEVRNHHVFEHFDRPMALVLLARWRKWLAAGGALTIEVPDFDASARQVLDPALTFAEKAVALRHLFGSHEASWAFHLDGWNEERFRRTLGALGYEDVRGEAAAYKGIRNLTIRAVARGAAPAWADQRRAIEGLLAESLVDGSKVERHLLSLWMQAVPETE